MGSTLLYLVRHAEHERSPAVGESDPGITALGERQAHLLGRRLADVPFDAVLHSPLRRAAETARILASYLPGVSAESSELLTDLTPLPSPGQLSEIPPRLRSFFDRVPADEGDPGGERLDAAFGQLATAGAQDRCELLVTHNFVIGWFVRRALDAPQWRWMGLNQFNCALTIIQISQDLPPMLISFNDLGHLPVELRGHSPVALRS